MVTTITDLKKRKKFGVRDMGNDLGKYKFTYWESKETPCLTISGDVFGDEVFLVINMNEVLFRLAKGYDTVVKCDGFEFTIIKPEIQIYS